MDENSKTNGLNPTAETIPESADPAQEAGEALTPAEIEKIVERILAKRLARLQMEADGRVAKARSEGRAEAERLAGMSEDERRRFESEAAKEREEALRKREEALNRRELRGWVADALAERGLSRELAEFVDCSDAEHCAACVDALEKVFRAAVQQSVDARLNRGRSLPRAAGDAQPSMLQRMRAAAGLNEG